MINMDLINKIMWTCPKCGRIFEKKGQMHSCKKYPLPKHFENKQKAKELYDHLLKAMKSKIGKFKVISLPCCIHLYGTYDFIALLPKKDKLEIRFALDRKIKSKRIFAAPPLSSKRYKNCLYVFNKSEIDKKLIEWLRESYMLKQIKFNAQ